MSGDPSGEETRSAAIRLLVVDDEALVRSGFRLILQSEPGFQVVGDAVDGAAAIEEALRLRPDVVLMDVRMPRMDGVEATRRLTEATDVKVLILTTFDLDAYLFDAVRAGASGFLLKDVPPDDLADAIRAVARGDALIEPRMTRRLLDEFARQPAGVGPRGAAGLDTLTQREMEVLRAVARGLSNAEIAEELYISETTVKTHVAHILTKLALRDRIQAVVLAYESGLVSAGG
ncbi:MAG TPA: response regulator transcription factor [Acidimicrobiales bacterium]|nr:response regulator transcription factor [Acidimicrobiales bacterium]